MASDPEAVFLGAELRRARLSAGITSQEELAARLGYERTVIAKAQSGERPPSPEVAIAYHQVFPHLDGLIERVRRTEGLFPAFFLTWVDAEKTATSLFYWAPVLVPGMFQVEAYCRPLMTATPDDAEAPEMRLAGRMERQQILSQPRPPLTTVVMAEAVLHRSIRRTGGDGRAVGSAGRRGRARRASGRGVDRRAGRRARCRLPGVVNGRADDQGHGDRRQGAADHGDAPR